MSSPMLLKLSLVKSMSRKVKVEKVLIYSNIYYGLNFEANFGWF